jgi:hypothetical protein
MQTWKNHPLHPSTPTQSYTTPYINRPYFTSTASLLLWRTGQSIHSWLFGESGVLGEGFDVIEAPVVGLPVWYSDG